MSRIGSPFGAKIWQNVNYVLKGSLWPLCGEVHKEEQGGREEITLWRLELRVVVMARFYSYFEGRTTRICWRTGCETKTDMEDDPNILGLRIWKGGITCHKMWTAVGRVGLQGIVKSGLDMLVWGAY